MSRVILQILVESVQIQLESQAVIDTAPDMSVTNITMTFNKSNLLSTSDHTDISRPSLQPKLRSAMIQEVFTKRCQSLGSQSPAPVTTFAYHNANGGITLLISRFFIVASFEKFSFIKLFSYIRRGRRPRRPASLVFAAQ